MVPKAEEKEVPFLQKVEVVEATRVAADSEPLQPDWSSSTPSEPF